MKVLFIGNSYTYFNDLPGLLSSFAAANGLEIATESVTEGGMTLLGHIRSGEAISRIRSGGWDVVVLQEQSTRPLHAPGLMDAAAQDLADEIKRIGARPALYLTWARRDHPEDQSVLDAAYRQCAQVTGATLVPVGLCWQRARDERPSMDLYEEDGSHPGPMGTYLAACAFYAVLAGRSPEGTPVREVQAGDGETYVPMELAADDASFLQKVAWDVVSTPDEHGMSEVERSGSDPDAGLEMQLVRELPLLQGVSSSDTREVLSRAERKRIPSGERICSEGERGDTSYILLDGEIRVQTSAGFDEAFDPWDMGVALDVESGSLLGEPYGYTVTAVTEVTALVIRRAAMDALDVERPALAAALKHNIATG